MGGIGNTVKEPVQTGHCVRDEQKSMFGISTGKKEKPEILLIDDMALPYLILKIPETVPPQMVVSVCGGKGIMILYGAAAVHSRGLYSFRSLQTGIFCFQKPGQVSIRP